MVLLASMGFGCCWNYIKGHWKNIMNETKPREFWIEWSNSGDNAHMVWLDKP